MNNLEKVLLKDIADTQTGPFGSQLHEEDYVENGTPIVTVEHLGETSFIYDDIPMVSDSDKIRLSKYTLREGDIVFSRVGSIDRSTYVSPKEDGWLFSGRCLRVRTKDRSDAKFLSYYFRQKYFKEMMLNISVGATMPSLNTSLMDNLELYLPPKIERYKIAALLSTLDNTINTNNLINKELETIAKKLYNFWFVQFDFPDSDGKPYKSSGGKMVWNKQLDRHIPQGWEVCELNQILKQNTQKLNIDNIKDDLDTIDLSVIPSRSICLSGKSKSSKFETNLFVLNKFDILFGGIRPYLHKGGFSPFEGAVTGTVHSFKPRSSNEYNYSMLTLLHENMFAFAVANSKGTKMPVVSAKDLLRYKVAYNKETIERFENLFSFKEQIAENIIQNHKLAKLRDWLLPMLMNGQVKIK